MTSDLEKKYPSKILLIGEYAALVGGRALSIPNWDYFGCWKFGENSFPGLQPLLDYLNSNANLKTILDLEAFKMDQEKSIYFQSNLSFGCGLGSSGVLTAAIYDRYSKAISDDISTLRNLFAEIESYFHGLSSGLDPLVSYTAKVILSDQTNCSVLDDRINLDTDLYKISLVDSGTARDTKSLVNKFQSCMSDPRYRKGFSKDIMEYNSIAVRSLINKEQPQFMEAWKKLSKNSLCYFHEMIPEQIRVKWIEGIDSDKSYFKLCGAGGGGFFLKLEPKF